MKILTQSSNASTELGDTANRSQRIIVTGAHHDSDTDLTTTGRQVDVVVEVKIPSGTGNGSYSTNYGVQTLP